MANGVIEVRYCNHPVNANMLYAQIMSLLNRIVLEFVIQPKLCANIALI